MSKILKKHMPGPYKRVARMVGYCLLLDKDADTWHGLTVTLRKRLTLEQRALMSWAVLRSMDRETALAVCQTVLGGAGNPGVPFMSDLPEAANWADCASPEELDAYCLASFNAMPRGRKAAFLEFVQGRQAA